MRLRLKPPTNSSLILMACIACLPADAMQIKPNFEVEQSMVVAWDSSPRSTDPRWALDANSQYVEELLHCALFRFDEMGQLRMSVADRYQWINPQRLMVQIKLGLRFSDGSLLTAQDVFNSFSFFIDPKTSALSPRSSAFSSVHSIDLEGDSTVYFNLKSADAAFLQNLSLGILHHQLLGKLQNRASDVDQAVCGPFVLEGYTDSEIKLKPNPHYQLHSKPRLAQLKLIVVKDEQTRFAKLLKGEAHMVQNAISRDKLVHLGDRAPVLKVTSSLGLNTTYLGFNMRDPICNQKAVREAISRAIDRQSIVRYVLRDQAVLARSLLPPRDPFFNSSLKENTTDIEAAKDILRQGGFNVGSGTHPNPVINLEYKTTTDKTRIIIANAIAGQLAKVGIKVNVLPLEWGKFKSDVEAGRVQMWSLSWIGFKDPDIYRYAFHSQMAPPFGPNRGSYHNLELDRLLDQGRATIDNAERIKIYAEVQKIIAEEKPYIMLWHENVFGVMRKSIKGFKVFADGRLQSLVDTWIQSPKDEE